MKNYMIVALLAYLCGSIPFGYILVRIFKGKDIRESGSGNIGATNVARTAPVLGVATLILDTAKGYLPTAAVFTLGYGPNTGHPMGQGGMGHWVVAIAALFAVMGHLFPVWLRFRGGKGVATAAGVFLAISPVAILLAFGIFLLVLAGTRFVSLASIVAAAAFPSLAYVTSNGYLYPRMFLATVAIPALIIAKHHQNIRRLINGTENRLGKKKVTVLTTED